MIYLQFFVHFDDLLIANEEHSFLRNSDIELKYFLYFTIGFYKYWPTILSYEPFTPIKITFI